MKPPDVTSTSSEWEKIRGGNTPLWKNKVHENVFSTDGGKTFTISTEREAPYKRRQVFNSRKVKL